jgi:hypothetical protein
VLTGCATKPPITERVNVPVIVPCVREVPARPAFEFERLTVEASDGAKVLALARDLPRHLKYEGDLVAVVDGCR